jgi:hypothetical protein
VIDINSLPVFYVEARPQCVPPELKAMSATAQIRIVDRVGGVSGEGICTASDYLDNLNATIARQSQGYFKVEEAAQDLADTVPGVNAKTMVKRMLRAFHDGGLLIREPGDKLRPLDIAQARAHIHLVTISDVNEWLDSEKAPYSWTPQSHATASKPTATPLQRGTAQDAAILSEVRQQGHNPVQLPKNQPGKPGVKAAIREALVGVNPVFPREGTQFDHAWERLRNRRELADKG